MEAISETPPPRTTPIRHFGTQDPIALDAYRAAFRAVRAALPVPSAEYPVDEAMWGFQVAQARREGAIR